MPELPEVETVKRGLEKALSGRIIAKAEARRAGLRVPFTKGLAERLKGRKILAVRRRAKYLLMELSGGKVLLMHLGMSGKILVKAHKPAQYDKHDHLVLHLDDGRVVLFHDPRRFGVVLLVDAKTLNAHSLLKSLGAEPLEKTFDAIFLVGALRGKKQAIKVALMDQRLVVGVGNIYASESLFGAGISPTKMAAKVTRAQAEALVASVKKVLRAAIKSGGSTLRDYVRSDGDVGYFQHHFSVYGRDGKACLVCQTPIQKIVQTGRSTFFCSHCQT